MLLLLRSGLRESLLLLLVGVLQCHCAMFWTVSTFRMEAYTAPSWSLRGPLVVPTLLGVIDPRVSFFRLALTEKLCHCHTLLLFTCSDDFLSLSGHCNLLRNVIRTAVSCDCASYS